MVPRLLSACVIGFVTISLGCGRSTDAGRAADGQDQATPEATSQAGNFREYSVPAGTVLNVRLETTVASNANREGDPVEAVLVDPVVIDDRDVIPVGAILKGVVSDAQPAGKVKGRAHLGLQFTRLVANVRGDRYEYPIAVHLERTAPATKGEDAKKIGAGTAGGAIIGALIGGGKGAAAGAAIGAGGGTAVVLATAGENVTFRHGSVWSLALDQHVVVKVPITH